MGWIALIGGLIALLTEIVQMFRDSKKEKKEQDLDLKKQKTEEIQSIARGLIDGDASRVVAGFDRLRKLKSK